MPGTRSPPVVMLILLSPSERDRPMKPGHHLYPNDELTNELEALARKRGASKSTKREGAR